MRDRSMPETPNAVQTNGTYGLGRLLILLSFSITAFPCPIQAQRPAPLAADSEFIEVLPVQGNIHMIVTGGSNITVQTGIDGALLVDTGSTLTARPVVAEVGKISRHPIRYVINTSLDIGHIGGNAAVADAGEPMSGNVAYLGELGIPVVAHQNGIDRLVINSSNEVPQELWPDTTFFGSKKTHYLNGESIEILHQPSAVSDSNLFVFFRRSDVLATGDVYRTDSYPRFYPERGGSLQGVLDALNRIIDIAIPAFNQQGGTLIVPGHGRISNESDVVEYRDMLTIVRDRVSDMIGRGMSLDEIKASRPTLEYDGIYGSATGTWTTEMFLTAVYEALIQSETRGVSVN